MRQKQLFLRPPASLKIAHKNSGKHDNPPHNILSIGVYPIENERISKYRDEHYAEERPKNRPTPAGQSRAADDDRRNDLKFETGSNI